MKFDTNNKYFYTTDEPHYTLIDLNYYAQFDWISCIIVMARIKQNEQDVKRKKN